MKLQENRPLSELSTFGIGGNARYWAELKSIEGAKEAVRLCAERHLPFIVIGKGSNSLFSDQGFEGVVLLNKIDFYETPEPHLFHVGAGFSFALLGVRTARHGWGGLEFASGIPATVGGAVFMNAGANGRETAESLVTVDFVNEQGVLELLDRQSLHFSYRHSPFQTRKGIIVGATFHLQPDLEARKKQLKIVEYRQKTQPYSDKSAGCIFRNPACGFAGQLIEQSGLKGFRMGGAQVSTLHANFIVNVGGATAEEVKTLMHHIQTTVHAQTGHHLEPEVWSVPR